MMIQTKSAESCNRRFGAGWFLAAALVLCGVLVFSGPAGAADDPVEEPPAPVGDVEEPDEVMLIDIGNLEGIEDGEAMPLLALDEAVDLVIDAVDAEVAIEGDIVLNVAGEAPDKQKPADDDWDDELEPDPAVPAQPRFVVNDETFDQWVFNQVGNAQKATERFHTTLNVQIDSIANACDLAPEQKQKLLLAGQGDIHRFFDKVEVCRKKFDIVKTDQNRINEIFMDIQPLQIAATAGLFDEKSLFRKVVKRTLTDEQRTKVDQVEKDRRQYQFKAKVELIVAALDDTIAMRAEQRKELTAMLLATPAPKRYGPYDSYLLLFKISRLPEDRMKKLLDPPQWRALDKQLEQARNLQPFLRQQGLLSDDEMDR